MSTKGVLHHYDFRYLQGDFEKARLEPTLITGHTKKVAEEKKDFYAIDVMSSPVKSLPVDETLENVRNLMKKEDIRHIPIVDNHKFVGIISDRDLLKLDMSGTFSFLKAQDVMNTVVIVADDETPLAHIARVLLEEKISAIPIINKKHALCGIISRSDILKVIVYNRLVLK
jgi:CBS domain-containing protein